MSSTSESKKCRGAIAMRMGSEVSVTAYPLMQTPSSIFTVDVWMDPALVLAC